MVVVSKNQIGTRRHKNELDGLAIRGRVCSDIQRWRTIASPVAPLINKSKRYQRRYLRLVLSSLCRYCVGIIL